MIDYHLDTASLDATSQGQIQLELDDQRNVALYFVLSSAYQAINCFSRLAFLPFASERCGFVYHYYKIHVSVPGVPAGQITSRQRAKIAKSVQQVYDSIDCPRIRYPFKFSPDE